MHNLAHILDRQVSWLYPVLTLIAISGLTFGVAGHFLYRSRVHGSQRSMSSIFLGGLMVFVSMIGGQFAIGSYVRSSALNEVKSTVGASVETVTVNDIPFSKAKDLLATLKGMHDTTGHHSHPTTLYRVCLITSTNNLELHLFRDSENPHEYWIYYPEYKSTKEDEIGHIITDLLDTTGG